jgi:hypothetical protein
MRRGFIAPSIDDAIDILHRLRGQIDERSRPRTVAHRSSESGVLRADTSDGWKLRRNGGSARVREVVGRSRSVRWGLP